MGFKAPKKLFVLDFTDTELDGLTVKARSAPLGEFMKLGELADVFEAGGDDEPLADTLKAMDELLAMFDGVLQEWDLVDDDDQPVPASAAGLKTLDMSQVMLIVTAWQRAMGDVPVPLPVASTDGSPFPAVSMPMEPLSASQAS